MPLAYDGAREAFSFLRLSVAAALLCAVTATGQDVYPFAVDQDALSGAPDFSFLNKPIDAAGRVFVRDGQFFTVGPDLLPNSSDDERIRFFGVNMVFGANFPVETDAVRIAKRLRKLGVNVARLHHLDTQPDSNPANSNSILTTGPYPTLNPIAVARLRALLDAFKQEGVYINLNLHVGYQFRPAVDNIPSLSPFPNQSKPVRMIHPRMVELQAEFARQMIEKLALHDDPVLAMVEINNETSLIYHWQTNSLEPNLQGEYRSVLAERWNAYLASRYSSTEALREAWGEGEGEGPELLTQDWRIENQPRASIEAARDGDTYVVGAPEATLPIIVKQVGFSVEAAKPYVAEIEMRADLAAGVTKNVRWDVKQDVSPWRTVTGQNLSLTRDWQRFRMLVTPQFAMDGIGRFGISIERVGAPVHFRGWRLYGAGRRGLGADESLDAQNIALPLGTDAGTETRTNDYLRFLAEQDRWYLNTMLAVVRETAGPLVPVAGTQVGFGGLMNYDSHRDLDYQDNHYYVDHYNFPNVQWDSRDWRIRDQSNVGSGADAFARMASTRQAGRPFTVSEFNQPWPNTFAAECDPTLAVFASFQNWDGVMHFAYSHGRGWDEGVPNGFNLNGDWTKWVSFGQSAWLFRSGAIRAADQLIEMPVTEEMRLRATKERRNGNVHQFLSAVAGYDPGTAFAHRVAIAAAEDGSMPALRKYPGSVASDTGEFSYNRDRRLWLIHGAAAAGVIGFPGTDTVDAGAISVQLSEGGRGYVSLIATALDGAPLEQSGRILVTNPGYTLRTQAGSTQPQRVVNYGATRDWWTLEQEAAFNNKPSGNLSTGSQPTYMEQVDLWLTLRTTANEIRVHPLDGAGRRMSQVTDIERVDGGFRIRLRDAPWFEIER